MAYESVSELVRSLLAQLRLTPYAAGGMISAELDENPKSAQNRWKQWADGATSPGLDNFMVEVAALSSAVKLDIQITIKASKYCRYEMYLKIEGALSHDPPDI